MNNHKIEHQRKLDVLLDRMYNEGIMVYVHRETMPNGEEKETKYVKRQTLREFISGKLGIHDPHTVNGWIDELVGMGILEHNPSSQLTENGHTKPSNDTRYFIHFEKITNTHIDNFNRSSSESQKENKNKSSKT